MNDAEDYASNLKLDSIQSQGDDSREQYFSYVSVKLTSACLSEEEISRAMERKFVPKIFYPWMNEREKTPQIGYER